MPRQGQPPVIIGHRGHADTLENTLVSFRESIAQGAQMVELDVRLSKDLVPMVCHDSTLKRVSGGRPGTVSARTSKHLLSIELGQGHRFATLETALAELTPLVPVNVELKFNKPDYRPVVVAVCELIRQLGVTQRILISSFWHTSLDIVTRMLPELSVAPLFGTSTGHAHEEDLEVVFARELNDYPTEVYPFRGRAAVLHYNMVNEAMIEKFARGQGTLLAYTIDDPTEMRRLIALGIDGIITNRPAILRRLIEELFTERSPDRPQPRRLS